MCITLDREQMPIGVYFFENQEQSINLILDDDKDEDNSNSNIEITLTVDNDDKKASIPEKASKKETKKEREKKSEKEKEEEEEYDEKTHIKLDDDETTEAASEGSKSPQKHKQKEKKPSAGTSHIHRLSDSNSQLSPHFTYTVDPKVVVIDVSALHTYNFPIFLMRLFSFFYCAEVQKICCGKEGCAVTDNERGHKEVVLKD